MNFNFETQVAAKFKLAAHKGDGVPTSESAFFHNLVLDAGLVQMGVGSFINRCCVGTGNSTPQVSQIGLDSFLASTTTLQGWWISFNTTTKPYSYTINLVYRFGEGVAAGNLSEIGLGWANTALWNRALIKDSNGNPTTLTILSDEYLDVTAAITFYFPEQTGSFDLLDKTGAVRSTHTYTSMPYFWTGGNYGLSLGAAGLYGIEVSSSSQSSPTGYISGTSLSLVSSSRPTATSYSYIGTLDLSAVLNIASIKLITFGFGFTRDYTPSFAPTMALNITPSIPKLNTQRMQFTGTFSWGRYTG